MNLSNSSSQSIIIPTWTADQQTDLEAIKTGASISWILTSAAMIFFMQAGFILVECGAIKKHHYSDVVVKNLLDTMTGALGFWFAGFGIAFSPTDKYGFFGKDGWYYATHRVQDIATEDLWVKWFFQFAFCNTASTILSGLLTERCRIEVYAYYSFMMSFIIYPVSACWAWNSEGWLYTRGYHDFAGSGAIHLLGGISGLVANIFVGTRLRRFQRKSEDGKEEIPEPQFPCIRRKAREQKLKNEEIEMRKQINDIGSMAEIKELKENGTISDDDIDALRKFALKEFDNPNYDNPPHNIIYIALGTFILWVGWFFFNGGSAYTLYSKDSIPGKIIVNTMLAGASGAGTAYFFKRAIHNCGKCNKKKVLTRFHLYDAGSVCNGALAGLVGITAPCDAVDQWAAVVIGIIAGFWYCLFSKLLLTLKIDDPVEAASVHYINGIWGVIACAIFDSHKGFVSGNYTYSQHYLGIQVCGCVAISAWGIVTAILMMLPFYFSGWHKYHPAIEIIGVGNLVMGEFNEKLKKEMREVKSSENIGEGVVEGKENNSDGRDDVPRDDNGSGYLKLNQVQNLQAKEDTV